MNINTLWALIVLGIVVVAAIGILKPSGPVRPDPVKRFWRYLFGYPGHPGQPATPGTPPTLGVPGTPATPAIPATIPTRGHIAEMVWKIFWLGVIVLLAWFILWKTLLPRDTTWGNEQWYCLRNSNAECTAKYGDWDNPDDVATATAVALDKRIHADQVATQTANDIIEATRTACEGNWDVCNPSTPDPKDP